MRFLSVTMRRNMEALGAFFLRRARMQRVRGGGVTRLKKHCKGGVVLSGVM